MKIKSNFVRYVITLSSGTIVAQAIPVAISPILTRLYSPEDFGILSIYLAITAISGSISNGKYENAIMLPENRQEALNIGFLCIIIALTVSIVLLIVIIFFKSFISSWFEKPQIENWLFLVPVSVLFFGVYNALRFFNIREKNYKVIALSSIYKSTGSASVQLILGVLNTGTIGLILGQFSSYVCGNYILIRKVLIDHKLKVAFNTLTIVAAAKRYVRFPKFTLPGSLLNSVSLNIISFLISGIYSTTILGYYSLAQRMLSLPSLVIGRSIGQVYFQQASNLRSESKCILPIFKSTLFKLCLISIPSFVALYFIVEPVFVLIFGLEWQLAGKYAKVLIPLIAIRFVSSTLSNTMHILEKQNITLIIQIVLLLNISIIFICAKVFGWTFLFALYIFTISSSMMYLTFLLTYYKAIINDKEKTIRVK